jgi:hypothetical protein
MGSVLLIAFIAVNGYKEVEITLIRLFNTDVGNRVTINNLF